jgi:hypothetical protein
MSSNSAKAVLCLLAITVFAGCLFAQSSPSSSASPAPAGAAPTPASSSTVAIESEMLAYEAIGQIAKEIGSKIECACTKDGCAHHVLLATPANMSAISAYQSFLAASSSLQIAYGKPPVLAADVTPPANRLFATTIGTAAPVGLDAASALAALKGSTTYSGSSFAPADQALYSYLEKYANCLVTMPYPGNYKDGNRAMTRELTKVIDARENAIAAYKAKFKAAHPAPGDAAEVAKYDPTTSELKGPEAAYNAFLGLLTGGSGNSIAVGAALEAATTKTYQLLTVGDVAAGGNTRVITLFLLNLFIPGPHPSFNGGAVISYTLRDQDGLYNHGGTLRTIYDYTKWKAPKFEKDPKGFNNFNNQ